MYICICEKYLHSHNLWSFCDCQQVFYTRYRYDDMVPSGAQIPDKLKNAKIFSRNFNFDHIMQQQNTISITYVAVYKYRKNRAVHIE